MRNVCGALEGSYYFFYYYTLVFYGTKFLPVFSGSAVILLHSSFICADYVCHEGLLLHFPFIEQFLLIVKGISLLELLNGVVFLKRGVS